MCTVLQPTHPCLDAELHSCALADCGVLRLCCDGGCLHQQTLTHHHLATTSLLQPANTTSIQWTCAARKATYRCCRTQQDAW